jgi:hypothetical protein
VGDFYIDLTKVQLYGPKTATGGWGSAVSLQGAAGTQGTAGPQGVQGNPGSKILTGAGTPQPLTGNVGDYWIDELSDSLYGPKATSGWKAADFSLRGPAGPDSVIYYNWTGFTAANWSESVASIDLNTAKNYYQNYTISVGALNSNIVSQGTVLVYVMSSFSQSSFEGFAGNFQLPASFIDPYYLSNTTTQNNEAVHLGYSFVNGSITFQLADQNPGTGYPVVLGTTSPSGGGTYGYFYRVIIIPGAIQGTDDPRKLTYSQVCSKYNIQP